MSNGKRADYTNFAPANYSSRFPLLFTMEAGFTFVPHCEASAQWLWAERTAVRSREIYPSMLGT